VGTFSALGLTIDPEAREALCREAVRLAERTEASILPLLAVTLANLHDQWKERMRLEAKWKENASPGDPFPKSFLWMGLLPPGESRFDVALQHVNDQGEIGEAIGRLGELAWTDAEAREDGFKIAVQRLPLSLPRQRVELGEIQGRDFALAWLLRRLVTVSAKETTSDRLGGLPDAALEPVARPMAESLQHHRLLTRRDDGTWWLVHQAVLDRWPRAAAWRKEEAQIYRTLDAMETDRSRWQEAIASGESDASHWLWTRPREVELLVDWMALRGTDDNPELAAFAKESTIAAVRQNGARAGRVLKVATYFGDLDWSSEILCAAGEFAPAACNELSKNGDTSALTNACHHDDVDLVRLLLRHGAGPNLALASGHTPLTAAASVGSLEVCDLLIAAGAEIDHADNEGWTPLTQAASKGHTAVVARLIAAGADPNRVTNKGWTPMTMAAENGHDAVVARLIADGAEIKHADDEGWTALMWAARNGHDALVGRLIAAGADVNHIKADGWSALMVAAFNGHDAVVTHLIAAGADINRSTHDVTAEALNEQAAHGDASITSAANINRWTALMWAARNGHDAIVGRLIAAGALIDQAADGYDSAVATLVASGVQMDSTAHNDRGTALILAAEHGHGVVLDRLLRAGARANYADHNGMTALIWAVVSGHTDVLGRLLAAGAQVDQTDNDGETALQIVAERGDLNIAVRLLSEGADVNLASHHGSTPLMEAVRGRDEEMVRLLLSRGANPELLNSDGETALDIALKIRAKAIARILSDAGNGRSSETESQCGSERRPQ
jgi:ankyrin repeat protein